MKKAIITFLLLGILGAIGCVMHPKYFFFIGTIQNNSSKKLYVLLSCDTTIESESQIERSRAYFINKNESQEIRVPNHPDFPPEHKWYINYYEADSLKLFWDSIKQQVKVTPVSSAYKKYLLKTEIILDKEVTKQNINIVFQESKQ